MKQCTIHILGVLEELPVQGCDMDCTVYHYRGSHPGPGTV